MVRHPTTGTAHYDAETSTLTLHAVTCAGRKVDSSYRVERLEPHPEIGFPAIRLHKLDKKAGTLWETMYDLIKTAHGYECSCGDWMVQYGIEGPPSCKHLRAALACGLLR